MNHGFLADDWNRPSDNDDSAGKIQTLCALQTPKGNVIETDLLLSKHHSDVAFPSGETKSGKDKLEPKTTKKLLDEKDGSVLPEVATGLEKIGTLAIRSSPELLDEESRSDDQDEVDAGDDSGDKDDNGELLGSVSSSCGDDKGINNDELLGKVVSASSKSSASVPTKQLVALAEIAGVSFVSSQQASTKQSSSDERPTREQLKSMSKIAGVSFRSFLTDVASVSQKLDDVEPEIKHCSDDGSLDAIASLSLSKQRVLPTAEELEELMQKAGVSFASAPACCKSATTTNIDEPGLFGDNVAASTISCHAQDDKEKHKQSQMFTAKSEKDDSAGEGTNQQDDDESLRVDGCIAQSLQFDKRPYLLPHQPSASMARSDSISRRQEEDLDSDGAAEVNLEDLMNIMADESTENFGGDDSFSGSPSLTTFSSGFHSNGVGAVNNAESSEHEGSNHLLADLVDEKNTPRSANRLSLSDKEGSASDSGFEQEQRPMYKRRNSEELELEDKLHSPNRPHPALEYPPLYFFLRRMPFLFDRIKKLYAFRWRLTYPLQKKVPFSLALRKVGIYLTWGELILLLPFFGAIIAGIIYTIIFPSVAITGKVARFALIAALVFAQRNSLFTLLVGIPFDRAIFYHKLAGRVAGITGVLHTVAFFIDPTFREAHGHNMLAGAFTGQINISGSVLMLLIVAITLSSLPPIRRRIFELFYYLHIIFTAGMVTCAFFHSGKLVPILAMLTWGTDLVIRKVVMARTRYPRKASLKRISETVVEINFPKTAAFAYNPGQYIYIAIPEISWLQWHPYSISSSPKQRVVTLLVRRAGSWSSALFDLAQKKQEVPILLEGPYGCVGLEIANDRKYRNIMLISGGIGITPMQSICDQLLYEKAKDRRKLNQLKFVWIERDPILMQEAEFVRRTSNIGSLELEDYLSASRSINFEDESDHLDGQAIVQTNQRHNQNSLNQQLAEMLEQEHSIDIASQLLSAVAPNRTTDEELDKIFESNQQSVDSSFLDSISIDNVSAEESVKETAKRRRSSFSFVIEEETSFAENSTPWLVEAPPVVESLVKVLDMQVYLTGQAPENGLPFARYGRPNIKAIFCDMKKIALRAGDDRVAVCSCAPKRLTELCRKACLIYSDDDITFDFHAECMEM